MYRLLLKFFPLVLFALLGSGEYLGLAHYQTSRGINARDVSENTVVDKSHRFKIRTITAGVNLKSPNDLAAIESSIDFLLRARRVFENEGYEIQTLRIATQPLPQYLNGKSRQEALADLKKIDEAVSAKNVLF